MYATPLSAEVTLLDFLKIEPFVQHSGRFLSQLHPPSAGNWSERYGAARQAT